MNQNKIVASLTKMFEKNRIVFWYDQEKNLRETFNNVDINNVEKIEIKNNEFALKYKILREYPKQKFLLYKEDKQPEELNNWLLDVQLSTVEFKTDLISQLLGDLELGYEFSNLVKEHQEFFYSSKRRESLKEIMSPDDSELTIKLKMLSICSNSEHSKIDSILESLLEEYSEEKDSKYIQIKKSSLDTFLWNQVEKTYNYKIKDPSVEDFFIELFRASYHIELKVEPKLSHEALIFIKRWKDSTRYKNSFEKLSKEASKILNIEDNLHIKEIKEIKNIDFFELVDIKILSELASQVSKSTISKEDCNYIIRDRRKSFWFGKYESLYEAINNASQFIFLIKTSNLEVNSLKSAFDNYCNNWYLIDQTYRKFIYNVNVSENKKILEPLIKIVENLYSNNFLLHLNDNWQIKVDEMENWKIEDIISQRDFFKTFVQSKFLSNNKKIVVIISDALRYEIGEELLSLIRQEDRYDGTLTPILSSLPSYTQLGMASLLPNKVLSFAEGEKAYVMVDGKNSAGTINRENILKNNILNGARAILANNFLALTHDESRSLIKENDVVYIYHNVIDNEGNEKVFEAVEIALIELKKLVKRLSGANASNIIITSDHGFIYQNNELDQSDFSNVEKDTQNVLYRDRRFLIGKNLEPNNKMKLFNSEDIGLVGDMQIQIPKSINRLRLQGSNSKYVHGGSSLQEIVVPVLTINKKRESNIKQVEVEIIKGASSLITSGQFSVVFFQDVPVTDKIKPRYLRVGIYTQEGKLISDSHELQMDLTTENPREREVNIRFLLSSYSNEVNGQDVLLKLEERVGNSNQYREYKSNRYKVRRSFTSDFDF